MWFFNGTLNEYLSFLQFLLTYFSIHFCVVPWHLSLDGFSFWSQKSVTWSALTWYPTEITDLELISIFPGFSSFFGLLRYRGTSSSHDRKTILIGKKLAKDQIFIAFPGLRRDSLGVRLPYYLHFVSIGHH